MTKAQRCGFGRAVFGLKTSANCSPAKTPVNLQIIFSRFPFHFHHAAFLKIWSQHLLVELSNHSTEIFKLYWKPFAETLTFCELLLEPLGWTSLLLNNCARYTIPWSQSSSLEAMTFFAGETTLESISIASVWIFMVADKARVDCFTQVRIYYFHVLRVRLILFAPSTLKPLPPLCFLVQCITVCCVA